MHIGASSRGVRAFAYTAEDPQFETHFKARVGRSLTVRPALNGNQTGTLGEMKAARKGTDHPTS